MKDLHQFEFTKAGDAIAASSTASNHKKVKFLAGGTNLVDLIREDIERPEKVVFVGDLPHNRIEQHKSGVTIGAMALNSDTANHSHIRMQYPLLSQAILSGASAQVRNMATNGGNLNQHTRCSYFYNTDVPCNKRKPKSGCGALQGDNSLHAIFGWSKHCVAVHPSDMCVALAALEAWVKVVGKTGERYIPFSDYHCLPGSTPQQDNSLNPGDLVTEIEIPANNFAKHSHYLRVSNKSSYPFALISIAVAMELNGNVIKTVRIAMGGVAHRPWRAWAAENYLTGREVNIPNFENAALEELSRAKPLQHNAFKIDLSLKAMVNALTLAYLGKL